MSKYRNKLCWAFDNVPRNKFIIKSDAIQYAGDSKGLGKLHKFDSIAEYNYWAKNLKLLEVSGAINDLKLQVPFDLFDRFEYEGKKFKAVYRADFTYHETDNKVMVIADVKGVKTALFKLKHALIIERNWQAFFDGRWRFDIVDSKTWQLK